MKKGPATDGRPLGWFPVKSSVFQLLAMVAQNESVVVRLVGGPMAGWDVTPDAPCLLPGWGQITTDDPATGYMRRGNKAKWRTDLEPATADEVDRVTRLVLRAMGAKPAKLPSATQLDT
jgi:hypothetical protein